MYAYHKWRDDTALIEENRLIMTAIARIAAIVIEEDMLSVLVIEGWSDDIVDVFMEAAETKSIKIEKIKELGFWYRIPIPKEYLEIDNW